VVQAGEGELLNAPIGPVAKSVAIYLRYRIGIPYRKSTELFRELFGLELFPASALLFDRKAAAQGEPLYEDLRDKIRTSDVVHADETSWRSDGVDIMYGSRAMNASPLSYRPAIGPRRWPKASSVRTLSEPWCATGYAL